MHFSDEGLSDSDDGFDADMEALTRACQITGTDPMGNNLQLTSNSGGAAGVSSSSDAESDGVHDLELVSSIQKRFANPTYMEELVTQKPLCLLPPDSSDADDCDEDYETLRAIQRRFAAYSDGGLKGNIEDVLHRPVQVGIIDSEKESSNSLFGDRTNAREGFLNCVDSSETTTQKPVACDDDSGIQSFDLVEWGGPGADAAAGFQLKNSNFPKSALTFVDAIKKNRSCQKLVRCKMMQIEARMEELKKLKERAKILKDFHVACKKRTGRALSRKKDAHVQLISVPKPRANSKFNEKKIPAMCKGPPENIHVSSYRETMATFPDSMSRDKWSKVEKENLGKGVKQQFQGMLLQRSVELFSCIDGSSGDSNNIDSIISSIKDLDFNPERMRLFLPKVNWEELAAMYVPGRSGEECQARFLNYEDPLINHDTWTAMEDKNLLHIVQQRGLNNWIDIAVLLGTNRTPFQCLARYQRSLNASILKREWTKEEDDQLRDAVGTLGESNWQLVASVMEGRTGTQCSNRWLKTLHPARQRVGKWTAEEDKRMKIAVTLFGPKTWKKVARCVPGRTQVQCRERWVNCLDPSLNMAGWSVEEDSILEAAIAEYGYCWSKVAACVPPRTDNQCRRRWKVLFPHEVPLLQAVKKIQKAALISNFVDRESERPALGPNDFLLPETNLLTGSENFVACQGKKRSRGSRGCKHIETDASGNATTISNAIQIGVEEVPRLTYGSELEIRNRRPVSRKGRSKRSYSTKQKTVPIAESSSPPCTDGMANGEAIRESALHYNNPKRSSRLEGKRLGFRGESMDGFSRSTAICDRKKVIEGGSNEGEDFVQMKECPLLLTDSNLQRVTVGTGASQSSRVSKLLPRRSVKPPDSMLETSEAEMPVGDATLSKRQEETKDGEIGTHAADDHLSPFPDSMPLMEIINKIRTANIVKARKKKRTENQETISGGECAIGDESAAPSSPRPADVNLSGTSFPFMQEITTNLLPRRDDNYLEVLREFDNYVISSEMCNKLQNTEFLSHHSTRVNFS